VVPKQPAPIITPIRDIAKDTNADNSTTSEIRRRPKRPDFLRIYPTRPRLGNAPINQPRRSLRPSGLTVSNRRQIKNVSLWLRTLSPQGRIRERNKIHMTNRIRSTVVRQILYILSIDVPCACESFEFEFGIAKVDEQANVNSCCLEVVNACA
jgi:hypothetical protein